MASKHKRAPLKSIFCNWGATDKWEKSQFPVTLFQRSLQVRLGFLEENLWGMLKQEFFTGWMPFVLSNQQCQSIASSFLACNSRLRSAVRRPHHPPETGSAPYPLLRAVWDYGISDPAVWCSAMWCGSVLKVSSSPLEGELTGSSWHLCYRPYVQCAPKGSSDVIGLLQWVWVVPLASEPRRLEQIGAIWYLAAFVDTTDQKHRSSVHLSSRLPSSLTHIGR